MPIDEVFEKAASNTVTDGSSLVNTSLDKLMHTKSYVCIGMEVENWTKFTLTDPQLYADGGKIKVPPRRILPAKREAIIAMKQSVIPTGSYGSVYWLLREQNRRVVIMWSAPFNFLFYDNMLGVGISSTGSIDHSNDWFQQMYKSIDKVHNLKFKRQVFNQNIHPVEFEDDVIQIYGDMGSTHKTQVKIKIIPKEKENLANSISSAHDVISAGINGY